ncbi:putative phosphoglycerate mutase [Hibiscus syriacus]|uniref:Phosphoglycerate mutase n=1 Tax=Hibiscus syriacus TaxID=106335 RepID=A0A6A2WY79_HIBSY|nr:major pollen allergen Lol p 11-like [Hibiscus syriacus]KAE8666491.1 putative phosphoglycerate mutase [Hibiscus syriacus]
MAKILLFIALCVIPSLVSSTRMVKSPLVVQGQVYCDYCRAGFETPKTRNMAGAKVKVVCSDRKTGEVVYEREGYTDSTGQYKISVSEDHLDEVCDAVLVKSSQPGCGEMTPGRERARVILTNFNGIASNTRFANAMGFMADEAEAGCAEVMKLFQEEDN